MKTNYTHLPIRAYEKPGEWGTVLYTFDSVTSVTPVLNAFVEESEKDYSNEYLTTVALEDGTISFNILKNIGTDMITSISYSTDNGSTWATTNNVNDKANNLQITVNVSEGDKILWKGTAKQLGYYDEHSYGDYVGSFFSSDCEFNAQGNVMSMLYGDNFIGETTLEEDSAFACLFYDYDTDGSCSIVDASNMVLPATTLAEGCYRGMFSNCTSLTSAPELPAETLAPWCYGLMFYNCISLNSITCLATDISATYCTNGWVDSVAESGTFTKATSMSSWTTGNDGIPTGWTIQNA